MTLKALIQSFNIYDNCTNKARASLVAQSVKNLPAIQEMQETPVWSLGQKCPLEKVMAAHCSILAWRIPWTEEPGGLHPMGLQRVGHDWETNTTKSQARQNNGSTLESEIP